MLAPMILPNDTISVLSEQNAFSNLALIVHSVSEGVSNAKRVTTKSANSKCIFSELLHIH